LDGGKGRCCDEKTVRGGKKAEEKKSGVNIRNMGKKRRLGEEGA